MRGWRTVEVAGHQRLLIYLESAWSEILREWSWLTCRAVDHARTKK